MYERRDKNTDFYFVHIAQRVQLDIYQTHMKVSYKVKRNDY